MKQVSLLTDRNYASGVREPPNRVLARPRSPSVPPATRDRRDFAQERAHATYLRLLDAAAEIFAKRGFDDTQTPDIAERAGVSVGTFYRYFGDKRQIFIELVNRHLEESYERVIGNLTPDVFGEKRTSRDRRAAVNHVIDILFQNTARNPRLHREFLAMAMRDQAVEKIRDEFEERGRAAIAALLGQIVSRARFPDMAAAAQVMLISAQDVALATAGLRGPPPSRAEAAALRGALADMLYRYVYGEP